MSLICLLFWNFYYNVMFVRLGGVEMKIKLYFTFKWNKIWVWQISPIETYWNFDLIKTYWYLGSIYSTIMLAIIFVPLYHVGFFIDGNGWKLTDRWICLTFFTFGAKIWISNFWRRIYQRSTHSGMRMIIYRNFYNIYLKKHIMRNIYNNKRN